MHNTINKYLIYKKSVCIFAANRKSYLRNGVFDPQQQDEWSPIILYLKKFLKQKKIDINTIDMPTDKSIFKYVYFDLPYPLPSNIYFWLKIFLNKDKNILICHEPPIVNPFNYMKIFHFFFEKIYTWNDDLINNKKYFKILLPQSSMEIKTSVKGFKKKKFLVLINSNKLSFFPFKLLSLFGKELYSERIKAIEFFEKNYLIGFSLYGRGWNKPKKNNLTELIFGYKKYLTYKGEIGMNNKMEILSNFRYCLCFENLTNVDGYITEKIFDCFKARCVPIYWGASNIEKYIPKNCFIDFRDFNDLKKLTAFLESIDEMQYNNYIENIEKLLHNKKFINQWFEKGFARFFLKDILELKNNE